MFGLAPEVMWAIGAIFAALIVATAIVHWIERDRGPGAPSELRQRTRSWWFMIILFSVAMVSWPVVATVFLGLVAFMALKEYLSLIPTRRIDRWVLLWAYLAIPFQFYWAPILDIFRRKYVWQQKMPLDNQAMAQAIEDVRGELDFACFQSTGSPRKTTVRTMTDVRFEAIPVLDGYELIIELEATGFLYNMARNIVGTLVWIGRGKQPADWIPRLIAEGDRRQAGMTAPAHGLTMLKVWYDNVDFETSPMLASTEELESAKAAGHRQPADD